MNFREQLKSVNKEADKDEDASSTSSSSSEDEGELDDLHLLPLWLNYL